MSVTTPDTPQVLLEHHLKALRLPTMLREHDKLARTCAVEKANFQTYLLQLTELELLDRDRRSTERRIRQAKFPVVKSIDSFDLLAIPALNKNAGAGAGARRVPGPQGEHPVARQQRHRKNAHALALGLHPTDEDLSVGTSAWQHVSADTAFASSLPPPWSAN